MDIRSYRRVFELERRIYRIDRLRLNPSGVPVRGVVYFLAILLAAVLAMRLPLVGGAVRQLPWYAGAPAGAACAALLAVIRIEGRPFHLAARALLWHRLGHHGRVSFTSGPGNSAGRAAARWWPQPIIVLPDGSDSRMRPLRYRGPGAVLVAVAHAREELPMGPLARMGTRSALEIRQLPWAPRPAAGRVIVLERGTRLRVR